MGASRGGLRDITDARGKPIPCSEDLGWYTQALVKTLRPACVILHGSLARGDYTQASDADIVVVGGALPSRFLDRLSLLIEVNTTPTRIEALGYSQSEFETMLAECHLTALEAMENGIPLYGETYFAHLRRTFDNMKSRGLQRDHTAWHIALR